MELPGDSSYLLRENRMSLISCVVSDESYFLFCVIGCADHCVYVGCGSIFANSGGSDRVGSELCGNCVSTESIFLLAMLLSY